MPTQQRDENDDRNEFFFQYNPAVPCVEMHVYGYHTSKQFRKWAEKLIEEVQKYKVNRVLGNVTYMVLIGKEDQEWLFSSLIPRAARESGFHACAIIKSKYYFNNVALLEIQNKTDKTHYVQQMFETREDAIEWLTNVDIYPLQCKGQETGTTTTQQQQQQQISSSESQVSILRSELEEQRRLVQEQKQQIEQQQQEIEELKKQISRLLLSL
jgi:hypothetical protein